MACCAILKEDIQVDEVQQALDFRSFEDAAEMMTRHESHSFSADT